MEDDGVWMASPTYTYTPSLLIPVLEAYRRALQITSAPGVIQDALHDLELIRAAGVESLEPVFELLEEALCR